ncbi:hypothetical protein NLJ89_g6519 [Agrocybe chaxingu]|uniref:Uncharacterized protein n=1 Tax=Agrocybe chaxingu TaxID=84603 RepID=A0A9W8JZ28_9AGAR|nr:hypothetical protein NLJ89_g6519 [Agrocybe chaxingu]
MQERKKTRLYITLQHRGDKPGFHWALLLAPKSESANINTTHEYRFHALNTAQEGAVIGANGQYEWRFEHQAFNCLSTGNLIGRILVAKLSSSRGNRRGEGGKRHGDCSELLSSQADRVRDIVETVPLVQNDDKWTCRAWVEQALAALRSAGGLDGEFATIPDVQVGGEVERDIFAFGERAVEEIKTRKTAITKVADLPHGDMRIVKK